MDLICPLCNGLREENSVHCKKCGNIMVNKGRLSDYFDPYSAYLEMSITESVIGVPNYICVHIFKCENCNLDKRIAIDKIIK